MAIVQGTGEWGGKARRVALRAEAGRVTAEDRCLAVAASYVDCFFVQAEDGIRDLTVTGVQTCALPISLPLAIPAWAILIPGCKVPGIKIAQAGIASGRGGSDAWESCTSGRDIRFRA